MVSKIRPLVPMAMAVALCQCDYDIFPDQDQEWQTVEFSIQGTVRSSGDGSYIEGARVVLGRGGHFSAPTAVFEVRTDAEGHYLIETPQEILVGNCGGSQVWLAAGAEGYQWAGGGYEYDLRPSCTEALQTMNVSLDPCDQPPEICSEEPFLSGW